MTAADLSPDSECAVLRPREPRAAAGRLGVAATVFAAWLAGRVPGGLPCLVHSGANAAWAPTS